MNAAQRVRAMLEGKSVDRPGVSAWKHFYLEDRHPVDFVKRTVEFQESNDWDFIKVSYNGYLMPEAFGADIKWSPDNNTFPTMLKHNINNPNEWPLLRPASIKNGALKREIDATAKMVEHFKGSVPILPTIFSPLTVAQEMSCGFQDPWPIMADIKYNPNELHKGLEIITETAIRFVEELVKVGVDGLFFVTQLACHCRVTPELYNEFGRKYDLMLLDTIKDKTWFNMLHIHGIDSLFFKEIEDYPVQAFNWEDISSNISLKYACENTNKILVCGIEQLHDFNEADRDRLKELLKKRVKDAVTAAGKDKLIIAPGCAIPTDVPEYRFTVLKEVLEELF